MTADTDNVDRTETARFAALAATWWDPDGPSRPLHLINPTRFEFIRDRVAIAGARVLDVGCGAGLLSEALAIAGAEVTAIDAGTEVLEVARLHALETGVDIRYVHATAERWRERDESGYDVVTCMELIEHVPDPGSLVGACASLCRPGGSLFMSTINRTPRAWLTAVLGAEYVLGLLPRGTHDYRRLVRPSELAAWGRRGGLTLAELGGIRLNPITGRCRLSDDVSVNYIAHLVRDPH